LSVEENLQRASFKAVLNAKVNENLNYQRSSMKPLISKKTLNAIIKSFRMERIEDDWLLCPLLSI
jgi:hypothetical protein